MVNLVDLNIDQQAFADVAGGDDTTVATASNGRQTPSMQKVIKEQMIFKAPLLWVGSVSVTDFLQTYESGIDGFIYAPAPGKVPFTAAIDPSTDAVNFYLFTNQGYVNGSGAALDMAGGNITNAGTVEGSNYAGNFQGSAASPVFKIDADGNGGGTGFYGSNVIGASFIAGAIDGVFKFQWNQNGRFDLTDAMLFTLGKVAPNVNVNNPSMYRSAGGGGALPFNLAGAMVYEAADSGSNGGHYWLYGSSQIVGMCLRPSGQVGIETDSPLKPLHVSDTINGQSGNPLNGDTRILIDRGINDNMYFEFSGLTGMTALQGILFSDDVNGRGKLTYQHSVDLMTLGTGGTNRINLDAVALRPDTDNVLDLGSATKQWQDIFTANAVTVSDERKKIDQGSASPYVALMKALNPRIFTFKNHVIIEAQPAIMGKRQIVVEEIIIKTRIVEVDGKFKEEKYDETVRTPQFEQVPLYDDKGKLKTKKDKFGQDVQVFYDKPIMETYEIEPAIDEKILTHSRPHTGLMAQAVKAQMDVLGIDWAGYAYYNDNGEDTHGLRLMEFIAPMLAYVQQVDNERQTSQLEIETLTARIEVLENV